ncbi:MAG: tRNA preQ1(34) S-adenosylmethionine ribosyltransferase-isomerase QueA [Candidatus Paceibacterota bacterium]
MNLEEFNYPFNKDLIAQEPITPRDHSRLLILDRKTQKIEHKYFYQIVDYLSENDILVFNDTKVIPAKMVGKIEGSQKEKEILLVRPKDNSQEFSFSKWPTQWQILGKNLKGGQILTFSQKLKGIIKEKKGYETIIEFNQKGERLKKLIFSLGKAPLPPYIKNPSKKSLFKYQTTYAKKLGSIAAPTAGFHFTKALLEKIKKKGTSVVFLTLHIGLGTFLPIKTEKIEEHKMEEEYFILTSKIAKKLNEAKKNKKRIIAVGTTVVRVLETCEKNGSLIPQKGWTNLFIYPGYQFKFVDALITNFHLPKSTPLLLVCAFANKELIFKAYEEAQKLNYRFYSFGDAMFII